MAQQDSTIIELIEVDNFKSFRERNQFGPLSKNLNTVIGPVGSGKSNFVDAIRFVMGEETSALCVEDLKELTHGACIIGRQSTGIASVTAVLSFNYGSLRKTFKRSTTAGSYHQSEYKIDDRVVTVQHYMDSLQELGIDVTAQSFIVFQGTVELISMKNSMELTLLFEEISGSILLKEMYERLKENVFKLKKEIEGISSRKQVLVTKTKAMKLENEYTAMYEKLIKKKTEFQLFCLFHNEFKIQSIDEDIMNRKTLVEGLKEKTVRTAETSCKLKEKLINVVGELAEVEQQISEVEGIIIEKTVTTVKAKEHVTFIQKKLNYFEKLLEKVDDEDNVCCKVIQNLEQELVDVKAQKQSYKSRLSAESQVVHLGDAQTEEFQNLKIKAQIQTTRYTAELDSINRKQEADRDEFNFMTYQKSDLVTQIGVITRRKEEIQARVEKLTEHISASENELDKEDRSYKELKDIIDSFENGIPRLQCNLDDVMKQLGEIQTDYDNNMKRQQRSELIEKFKTLYPGCVYDRVVKMCLPISDQYSIVVNRLLEPYLEAIIVDTEETAGLCIKYLKSYLLEPETFLPVDNLQVESLEKCLRNIREIEGVKLLYDVLKFDLIIYQVAQFITRNALVCETAEDALHILRKTGEKCHATVALDGTFFHESGIMSHRRPEPEHEEQYRSDRNEIAIAKSMKKSIINELHETLEETIRKKSQITTVNSQRQVLTQHLQNIKFDRELLLRQINDLEDKFQELKGKLEKIDSRIEEIKSRMSSRDFKIQQIKERVKENEDDLFADFCNRNRISMLDLRQYERHHELGSYREHLRERFELKNRKNRLVNQLDFERRVKDSRNRDIELWKQAVDDYKKELVRFELTEKEEAEELEKYEVEVNRLRTIATMKKTEVELTKVGVNKATEEVDQFTTEMENLEKAVSFLESQLEMAQWERYNILKQNKVEGVTVPFLFGNLEDILNDFGSAQELYDRLSRIVIDYSSLSNELKDSHDLNQVREKELELMQTIHDLSTVVLEAQARDENPYAARNMPAVQVEIETLKRELESAQSRAREAAEIFEDIKKERRDKFQNCFNHIVREINIIYKALYQSNSVEASLTPEDSVEPYLDGISFSCVTPGKPALPFGNLSGDEKTMVTIALLFAIHSYKPAPFLILDEIDRNLSDANVCKLAAYIGRERNELQTIVISSRAELYSTANCLIGLCSDDGERLISRILPPINLDEYV